MSSLLRVLTVDDEPLALRRLKLLLQTMSDVAHVGEAHSCAEARRQISDVEPDVILLDIRMRDGDGFEIVQELAERRRAPSVIFVTAFDHYAVKAFEGAVVDYLLKPVERDRLASSLSRVRQMRRAAQAEQRIDAMHELIRSLRSAAAGREAESYESEFWVRGGNGFVRVPVDAIECASSQDDYVALHTGSGAHLMRGSIRQFQTRVEPGVFVRVHKGWLVRKTAITNIRAARVGGAKILLRSGREVPAGRVYLRELRNSLRATPANNL